LESQKRAKEAEKKAHGKPDLRPKHEQETSEPNGTNSLKKAQQEKEEEKPSPPVNPPVTPENIK
jgi:hypothetical protein